MFKLLSVLLLIATPAEAAPVAAAISAIAAKITVSSIISSVVSGVIASVIGGIISKAIGNKQRRGGASQREDAGQLQTIFAGQAWVPHAYGEMRVGAVVTDQFVTDAQGGNVVNEGEFSYAVYAISVGEIESVSQIYYYDIEMLNGTPSLNTVLSGTAIAEKFRDQVRMEIRTGGLTQGRSTLLGAVTGQSPGDTTNARYGTNDIGAGVAYLVIEIKRDREEGIIGEATPQAITLDIQGRKVRDIRQSGSPYVYSNNPALICLEELRDTNFGAGFPDENIDFYSFAEWANVCDDEDFEIHGRFPQGAKIADIIAQCEIHSDTDVVDANGVITAKPNVQTVGGTSIQINDANIIDGLQRTEPATSEIFTVARVSYTNEQGIEELTIRQFDSDTINEYGYRPLDIDFVLCKSKAQAEKLGARALVQQTLPQITGTLTKEGYEVSPGDICTTNFTFGDILPSGSRLKIVGVDKKRVTSNKPVSFVARLYDDEVFTQALNSIQTPATVQSTAPGVNDVPAPNVTQTTGTTNDNRVVFRFDNGRSDLSMEWQLRDSDAAWETFPGPIGSASPTFVNLPNDGRALWQLRFRFVNTLGIKGGWHTSGRFDNRDFTTAVVDSENNLQRIINGNLVPVPIAFDSDRVVNIVNNTNVTVDFDSEMYSFSIYQMRTSLTDVTGLTTTQVNNQITLLSNYETSLIQDNAIVQLIDDSDNPRTYIYDRDAATWTEQNFAVDRAFIRELTTQVITTSEIAANSIQSNNYDSDTFDSESNSFFIGANGRFRYSGNGITIDTDGDEVINADVISAGTLDASQVTVSNIDADNINTGTIDASFVAVTNLDAGNITTGTLNAENINVTNLNASNITSGQLPADRLQLSNEFTNTGGVLGLSTATATGQHTFSGSVPNAPNTVAGAFQNRYFEADGTSLNGTNNIRIYNSPSTAQTETAPARFARVTAPTMNATGTSTVMINNLRTWVRIIEPDTSSNAWSSTTTYDQYDVVRYNSEYWYSEVNSNLNNTPSDASVNWNRLARDQITLQVQIRNGATVLGTIDGPLTAAVDSWGADLPEHRNVLVGIVSGSVNVGLVATGTNLDFYLRLSFAANNGTVIGHDDEAMLAGFGVYRGNTTLTTNIVLDNAAADGTGSITFETTTQADTTFDVTL